MNANQILNENKAAETRKARRRVNASLNELGRVYHDGLPIQTVNDILEQNGFSSLESAIYCGRDGRFNEAVHQGTLRNPTYLEFSWHKMEVSGRYEVVAYVS